MTSAKGSPYRWRDQVLLICVSVAGVAPVPSIGGRDPTIDLGAYVVSIGSCVQQRRNRSQHNCRLHFLLAATAALVVAIPGLMSSELLASYLGLMSFTGKLGLNVAF